MSASKKIEPGARAMLLLADSLFRVDVVLGEDTLRIIVRNLSSGRLEVESLPSDEVGDSLVIGEALAYRPAHSGVEFALGAGEDRVAVSVLIGTVRFAQHGTVRVSGQAIVRPAPAD